MFLTGAVPALAYGVMSLQIPESPRYLVAKGETTRRARCSARSSRPASTSGWPRSAAPWCWSRARRFNDLRKPKGTGLLPIVWIGIALSVFQQFVGINVIFYYSSALWQQVGFSEDDALTITVITSVTNIVVTLVAIAVIDKIGRRILLLIGSAGMAVTLGTLAVVFGTAPVHERRAGAQPHAPASSRCSPRTCSSCSSASPGGRSCGCCSARCSTTRSAPARSASPPRRSGWPTSPSRPRFPKLADIGLAFAYGFYTFFAVLSFFFVAKFVKETKGRQLEDM